VEGRAEGKKKTQGEREKGEKGSEDWNGMVCMTTSDGSVKEGRERRILRPDLGKKKKQKKRVKKQKKSLWRSTNGQENATENKTRIGGPSEL